MKKFDESEELTALHKRVAELRQAQEAMRWQEKRYRSTLDAMLEGCQIIGYDWRYLYVNDAVTRHGRRTKSELLGHTMMEIYPGIEETEMFGYLRRCMEKRIPHRMENEFTFPDGIRGWFELSIQPVPEGIFILSLDITERKKAEEAVRESEEKLRIMFDSVTEGIVVSDLGGNIIQVNKAIVDMHGYHNKEELVGRSVFEFIPAREKARGMESLKKTLEEGYSGTVEYTLLKRNGGEFPAELSAAVMRDASGKPIGLIAITRDITERKRMQEQLIITNRLASIGELASGVACELSNPLTSIMGFAELLLREDVCDEAREKIAIIHHEAQRAAEGLKNLLTFARERTPLRQLEDINGIIATVLGLRAYGHKINNIRVRTQFAPDLPPVMADTFQLQQVFFNLIINAEYFMTRAHGGGTLSITTEKAGDMVRTIISDDGPGISEGDLEHLFDPFFTTKQAGKGTGLGLSICHGIVTGHGGRIYVQSQLGWGATFVVELPIGVTSSEVTEDDELWVQFK